MPGPGAEDAEIKENLVFSARGTVHQWEENIAARNLQTEGKGTE